MEYTIIYTRTGVHDVLDFCDKKYKNGEWLSFFDDWDIKIVVEENKAYANQTKTRYIMKKLKIKLKESS